MTQLTFDESERKLISDKVDGFTSSNVTAVCSSIENMGANLMAHAKFFRKVGDQNNTVGQLCNPVTHTILFKASGDDGEHCVTATQNMPGAIETTVQELHDQNKKVMGCRVTYTTFRIVLRRARCSADDKLEKEINEFHSQCQSSNKRADSQFEKRHDIEVSTMKTHLCSIRATDLGGNCITKSCPPFFKGDEVLHLGTHPWKRSPFPSFAES